MLTNAEKSEMTLHLRQHGRRMEGLTPALLASLFKITSSRDLLTKLGDIVVACRNRIRHRQPVGYNIIYAYGPPSTGKTSTVTKFVQEALDIRANHTLIVPPSADDKLLAKVKIWLGCNCPKKEPVVVVLDDFHIMDAAKAQALTWRADQVNDNCTVIITSNTRYFATTEL